MVEDYESAIEDFTDAIKQNLNLAAAYSLRGLALCFLGYAKANQGNAKEARNQYNLALEDFKEAIEKTPNNPSYHKGPGTCKRCSWQSESCNRCL